MLGEFEFEFEIKGPQIGPLGKAHNERTKRAGSRDNAESERSLDFIVCGLFSASIC